MKHRQFSVALLNIGVIILLLALLSCGGGRAQSDMLRAAALVEQYPDSALALMEKIDTSSLRGSRDRALYALLLTEARYKAGFDDTDDSLISIATQFYDNDFNSLNRAKAYYYKGYIAYNGKNYADAIINLKKGEKTALNIKDSLLSGLIIRTIGDCYQEMRTFSLARDSYRRASVYFSTLPNVRYSHYNALCLAVSLFSGGESRASLAILDSLLDISSFADNKNWENYAMELQVRNCQAIGDNESAVRIFSEMEKKGHTPSDVEVWTAYGISNIGAGDLKEAERCEKYVEAMSPGDTELAYHIAKAKEDYKEALRMHEKFYKDANHIFRRWVERDYDRVMLKNIGLSEDNYEMEKRHNRLLLALSWTGGILFVAAVAAFFIVRERRKKSKYEKAVYSLYQMEEDLKRASSIIEANNMELERSSAVNESKDKIIEEKNSMLIESLSSRFNTVERLIRRQYENTATKGDSKKAIYAEVETIIKEFREDDGLLKQLESIVNSYCGDIMTSFKNDVPGLKPTEIRLFLFMLLGFSPQTISVILSISVEKYYNWKSVLKKKIQKEGDNISARYLPFF